MRKILNALKLDFQRNAAETASISSVVEPRLAAKIEELRAANIAALEEPSQEQRLRFGEVVLNVLLQHDELQLPRMEYAGLEIGLPEGTSSPSADRIEEIAREAFQAFDQLQGQPEQQKIAKIIGHGLQDLHYRAFADQNGPQDLMLTIDAAMAIEHEPQTEAEILARIRGYSGQIAMLKSIPDGDVMGSKYSAYNLVDIHLDAFKDYKGGVGEKEILAVIGDGMRSNNHYREKIEHVAPKRILPILQAAAEEVEIDLSPDPLTRGL
ncbi:hypothetical protein ACEOSU_19920 [Pseudomonas aeruginosa]